MTSSHKTDLIEDAPAFPPANATAEEEQAFYKTDPFRMRSMKIVPCSKRFTHDWTECPYAHPQEKARRRDPRLHNYTGIACPSMKKEGACAFGDHCPYAHNVFEYWLHPTRYRTQLCNDGTNCHRKICFFAHSLDELRVPACKPFVSPESLAGAAASAATDTELQKQQKQKSSSSSPPSSSSGMMFAPSPRQQQAETGRVRESLDVLLHTSPAVIRSAETFSQHAARMATPFDAPAESTRLSSGSSGASPEAVGGARSPTSAAEKITTEGKERVVPLSSQEEQVVDMVTNMLAQDRLSAAQAASILQQMLPESSLATLQTRLLGGGGPPSSPTGGASPPSPQQQQQQQQHQSFAAVATSSFGEERQKVHLSQQVEARESMDSTRSSFDKVMRMSFENSGSSTPRRSYDTMMVSDIAPPPAHPQYWLQQQQQPQQQQQQPDQFSQVMQQSSSLFSVPEAFPMINAPRRSFGAVGSGTYTAATHTNGGLRKSTGGIDLDLPPFPGAGAAGAGFLPKEGLDREFGRLSFEETINHSTTESEINQNNPFTSILYDSPSAAACGGGGGHNNNNTYVSLDDNISLV